MLRRRVLNRRILIRAKPAGPWAWPGQQPALKAPKPAIAQLVEHLTVDSCSNQMVPGSIPGGRISFCLPVRAAPPLRRLSCQPPCCVSRDMHHGQHRSHFGSRYKSGPCFTAGLLHLSQSGMWIHGQKCSCSNYWVDHALSSLML